MKKSILFENIWFDEDIVELKIVVNDEDIVFTNSVYASYPQIEDLINDLNIFKDQIHGGLYDIELGEFGQEYANGAFLGRLHFNPKYIGIIYICITMQTDFFDFGIKNVAKEATLYLNTEPALLDNFISQLKNITENIGNLALLECRYALSIDFLKRGNVTQHPVIRTEGKKSFLLY